METIFMNCENSKTNEPHRFRLVLADKLNLKDPNKDMALANLSIYDTLKTLNVHITTINLKNSAPTWNDKFDLIGGSYSVSYFQDCLETV